ncbi:TetR/AcrR family transcriptional regulator [Streptomyces spiramenti]|uniref:TetR/AcrR family transcriptional regulator n=1 Tax=Streptomyces spiramenti TaxID=2720606 RepID=A0ABX1AKN5_9ACTN|nr:TetR/AcrR family transcriptional regulator [Streptomyces spiramenti]NJP64820.1 TetR/AcrR family transcriptional regulator [Streptomyces spiramenti]
MKNMPREGSGRPRTTLDLLWGTGDGGTRGPRPTLSPEKIVQAAVEVADADGLGALSMQKVADRLGFTTMSLYRHVPGKEPLIELMIDRAVGTPPELSAHPDWRTMVEAWIEALWNRYQQHPWMLHVQAGPPLGPNQLSWLESLLTALADTGLTDDERFVISLYLNGATLGIARLVSDAEQVTADRGVPAEQLSTDYSEAMGRLIDSDRFPVLTSLVRSGALNAPASATGRAAPDYEFGLRRLMDGVEAYVAERT